MCQAILKFDFEIKKSFLPFDNILDFYQKPIFSKIYNFGTRFCTILNFSAKDAFFNTLKQKKIEIQNIAILGIEL